ncbi:relaxin receptor 1 isoform X2 [Silurus meridionalis]|uniref:relaxin receptor 1 isoform X2 n=1 Tax=Silurus meridionalis TaxID=175797 RepID=UPI001EEABC53|nr:relaxin receptor 1 isoform X2 [Silurus meridionalis]
MFPVVLSLLSSALLILSSPVDFEVCPLGQFPCGNLSVCLAQPKHCNGQQDCPNGADEENCVDNSGWPHLFDAFMKTRSQEPKECMLDVYPDVCYCEGWKVNCNNKNLQHVPAVSSNITALELNSNGLISLHSDLFVRYRHLERLHLENNSIEMISKRTFSGLFSLRKLFLSQNRISSLKAGLFTDLSSLEWLILDENRITSLRQKSFEGLKSLFFLSLLNNSLEHLPKTSLCFEMPRLNWLDLSLNKIRDLPPSLFHNLHNVRQLNISNNPLTHVYEDQFDSFINLQSLSMEEVEIPNISIRTFRFLTNLSHIYFKRFEYCTYSPNVRSCKPNTDGISSFENLLANIILRVFVWVVAFAICFGNVFVICLRSCVASENEHHTMAIKSLCCADCLMGVYLFFIGAFDVKYCGEYNRHAHIWMESLSCQLIGSLALLSTEVSVMMLTYMTLEKYVCIVFPFHHYRAGRKRTLCSLTSIWALGFVLALAPFCDRRTFGNFYGRNGVCFPLHSEQVERPGARCYSTGIFLGLNLLAFILIVFSYSSMFYSIQKTAKSARQTTFDLEVSVAKRFFFIVFTDAMCWIPIFLLKILSLLQVHITGTLILWVVIFILPINSALNPILYTITTSTFQERLRVCVHFRCMDNH